MAAQAKEHVGKCCPCLAFKARQQKTPLENIMATHPLELVHLDYLCLEPGKHLEENVLVVTDHFTRYAQAYVTKTQTAQMTAKTLWDKFIVHHGLPEKILTDQGHNFESQLVADLCKLMGTQKVWTSPYHLQTNGQCKRFTSTLINMLGMLPIHQKMDVYARWNLCASSKDDAHSSQSPGWPCEDVHTRLQFLKKEDAKLKLQD